MNQQIPLEAADPLPLARALIRCPSVTPRDEGAQDVLAALLTRMGFTCHRLPFGDVPNLFARRGGDGPHFCFAGHTDVVPAGDLSRWTHDPFGAVVEDGKLYGRGAADMKGNIAAFIAAVARLAVPETGSVSLLITGDEEGPSVDGTVRVLDWMARNGHVPAVCLVGEPSNPERLGQVMRNGRRGSLNGVVTVAGRQGHTAYPHLADNPLPRLVRMAEALAGTPFDAGNDFFPPTDLQLTSIDTGNAAFNVIPAAGRLAFNVRFNNLWTRRTLEAEIRRRLEKVAPAYELEVICNAESFMTAPGPFTDLCRAAIREVTGIDPEMNTGGGTSDARFIHRYCPVVEFGLVNATIHQVDEYCTIQDLERLTEIYRLILERYFEM